MLLGNPAKALAHGGGFRYFAPAPLEDVLFEQLEFLLGHASSACAPDCPDCARLETVRRSLLEPFRGCPITG
jgi:hypothetical protein